VAELVFFTGTMDCGKSTLALQTDYNHRRRGRAGLLLTRQDRAGEGRLSRCQNISTCGGWWSTG
jgi:thymidine kinase